MTTVSSCAAITGRETVRKNTCYLTIDPSTAVATVAAPTGDTVDSIGSADTAEAFPARTSCTGVTPIAAVLTRVAIGVRIRRADHDSAASIGETVGTVCALPTDTSVSSVTAYSARSLIA